ncbi:peptidylprolyl isomerase [Methylovirgula ligni]|uniref:Parvulin-like PPIase n=1 Tax=Methylovirgula ligni TaxID=569860 RepID=A0A3D9YZJ2_9HYPH|nr:peptidylprolyl isomerase [Methylovirgula ligni]QAY96786.1 peptidylprolyl isomerase [Methylovirgula ligni]REF88183.1 peptidyl-prolyl cis-trans isomerase D [Methylovirgula ligni]
MLDALRASSQTWIGRIIMAVVISFLIIAFGFWGIADIFRGFGANTLARVGSAEITPDEFRNTYQTQLLRMQEQQRRAISADEAHERGIDRQVLARLLSDSALNQEAHRLGLALSDNVLAQQIMQDDAFKGANGQFSQQVFEQRLQDNGLTERGYLADTRAGALRDQIVSALTDGLTPPRALLEIINRYYNEQRSIDYVILPKTAAGSFSAPTDAMLKSYFEAHRELYRQPEYRKISLLVLTAEALAQIQSAQNPITDAEIEKSYEAVKDHRYTQPEKREIQQIVFPDEKSADAAAAKLAGGETFAALIAERKLTPKDTDLGTVTEAGLADKAAAAAAFAIPSGGVTKPVQTQFGWAILHAVQTAPKVVIPLVAIKGEIARDLAIARAQKDLGNIHDKIEDERAAGKSIADAAKALGLSAQTIDAIDAQGNDKAGKAISGLGDPQAVLKAVFASDIGVDNDPVQTKDGGAIWFDVLNIDPARNQTFDEVKARVTRDWVADQTAQRLVDKSVDLAKKLDAGATLAAIATSDGNLPVKHIDKITRLDSKGLSRDLLDQVFNRAIGKAGSAGTQDGGRIVFKVTNGVVPPISASTFNFGSVTDQMKTALNDDMTAQFVSQLETRLGTRINPQIWQSVSGAPADQQ